MENKPKVYLGGPGTGKTTKLAESFLELNSDSCLFLGYNGLSIREFTSYVSQRAKALPTLTTFPGICAGLIRGYHTLFGYQTPPQIVGFKERGAVYQEAVNDVNQRLYSTDPQYNQQIQKEFTIRMRSLNKIGGIDLATVLLEGFHHEPVFNYWHRFSSILIDDIQDILPAEWLLFKKLTELNIPITITCNYNACTSPNAQIQTIPPLVNTYQVTHLTDSYRCRKWVCDFYNQLSEYNTIRNPYTISSPYNNSLVSQNYVVPLDNFQHQLNWITHQTLNCIGTKDSVTVGIICRSLMECQQISESLTFSNIPHTLLRLRSRLDTAPSVIERVVVGLPSDIRGLEFSVVILPSAIEGNWPIFSEKDIPLARRQFLTSIGKAKSMVFFGVPATSQSGHPTKLSKFIQEGNYPELTVRGKI